METWGRGELGEGGGHQTKFSLAISVLVLQVPGPFR